MLAMTGRVTMRGLARWAGTGGSSRTIQRFLTTSINWATRQWVLMRHPLLEPDEVIGLGGDEVVVTKAGTHTYGVERFFSSLSGNAVPGLGFLRLALISVTHRTSSPVMLEQLEKPHTATAPEVSKKPSAGTRGRPQGSTNQQRRDVAWSPSLRFVHETSTRVLQMLGTSCTLVYVVFDGALGHQAALQMVRHLGVHVLATLRYDAALSCPYAGPYAGRGQRKKYGTKLDYRDIPEEY